MLITAAGGRPAFRPEENRDNRDRPLRGTVRRRAFLGTQGTTAIGSLTMGWIISTASARVGIFVGGTVAILSGVTLLARRLAREARGQDSAI